MKKKCNVVLIATDKAENALLKGTRNINYHHGYLTQDYLLNELNRKSYHLYITSNDEIKEGDWIYHRIKGVFKYSNDIDTIKSKITLFKIIATTDTELHKDRVAKIGLPFIEKYISEYNKGNQIKEIDVEFEQGYEGLLDFIPYYDSINIDKLILKPKLRSDGTIIIHKIQEVFTKEDMKNAYNAGASKLEKYLKKEVDNLHFETWFEQNY